MKLFDTTLGWIIGVVVGIGLLNLVVLIGASTGVSLWGRDFLVFLVLLVAATIFSEQISEIFSKE